MLRNTKIVATLGPASSTEEVLSKMILAGVNVVRINFSHGKAEDHIERVRLVRDIAARLGKDVGVMADLQGPKIRIGTFANGKIQLASGSKFILDANATEGDETRVGLDYKELVSDVKAGDTLLLDDGRIEMKVDDVFGSEIHCFVVHGGILSNKKGINKLGGGLSAPALTAKDMDDIKTAVSFEADFVAVSFPKNGADMYMARELMRAAGGHALMIAKVERTEALYQNLEELLAASDGVMVARGDLAVEIGDAAVPAAQKRLIRMAREMNKLSITATQMMESMIQSPVPTRAEVSDVANAVLDGTDAVMLSAETASGQFPVETVETMARICIEAEKSSEITLDKEFLDRTFTRIDQSIAMAALFTAHHLKVKAIAALTESGSTALWMSRLNAGVPIYALTPKESTRRRLALYRDVNTILMETQGHDRDSVLALAEQKLLEAGVVEIGDTIVLTNGEPIGKPGGTNTLKIVKVGYSEPKASEAKKPAPRKKPAA
ncbi:pyruvate kinase [Leeia sp. TBRC 13508]|uniref:Pyruvate kinase n=1 Tax=Leeia speluncae TaxID=2884804 RepID=A0ABS8D5T1_9NEIS|nr:pyruvate kinase [Leeia speluncae]MCB6183544.1 pyruvate kinase [Leeia speluncae]